MYLQEITMLQCYSFLQNLVIEVFSLSLFISTGPVIVGLVIKFSQVENV
jgi:hypothetical protein